MKKKSPGIVNVFDNLWLGTWETEYSAEQLKKLNISHIIGCGAELEPTHPNHFKYHMIRLLDQDTYPLIYFQDDAYNFLQKSINEGTGLFVYGFKTKRASIAILLAMVMRLWECCYHRAEYKLNRKGVQTSNIGEFWQNEINEWVSGKNKQTVKKFTTDYAGEVKTNQKIIQPINRTIQQDTFKTESNEEAEKEIDDLQEIKENKKKSKIIRRATRGGTTKDIIGKGDCQVKGCGGVEQNENYHLKFPKLEIQQNEISYILTNIYQLQA